MLPMSGIASMLPSLAMGGPTGVAAGAAGGAAGLGGLSALAGPWGMLAQAGISAFMGAKEAEAQATAQRIQFEEQEFQRKWQNQIKNREIAKSNAARWFNNQKIAEAANKNRAERDFYLRYNFKNEVGDFSRQSQQVNDGLMGQLSARGISSTSGTGKALLKQATIRRNETMQAKRLTHENALLGSARQQQADLSKRDFTYNESVPFMPGVDGTPTPSSAFQTALMSGAASMVGGYTQGVMNQAAWVDAGGTL